MPKKIWKNLFVAALLSSCAVKVPNIRVAAAVEDIPGIAALQRATNTDEKRRMDIDDWFDFLYAQVERPDRHDPDCSIDPNGVNCSWLPAKGPALCVSSEDWQKNETAIAQLCVEGKCSYDQQKTFTEVTGRVQGLISDTMPVIKEGEPNGSSTRTETQSQNPGEVKK